MFSEKAMCFLNQSETAPSLFLVIFCYKFSHFKIRRRYTLTGLSARRVTKHTKRVQNAKGSKR